MKNGGNDHLATLADLAAAGTTGLTLRCGPCARSAAIPIADLIARHGGLSVAYEIAARHTCSRCGGRALTWWDRAETSGAPRGFKY
jgi:hypothetical protein